MGEISNKKRVQIDKNQAITFGFVAAAAVIAVTAMVVSKGIWDNSRYVSKVIDKKKIALNQLELNKEEIRKLEEAYNKFDGQNPNLLGGSIIGDGDRDGSNSTLVLDALPNKYDFPALTASVEKMLIGYGVESIGGNDDSVSQASAGATGPVEIPFTFEVDTTYVSLKELITSFDKSIRPFNITNLEFSGTNTKLKAIVSAKTFYQPDTSLKIVEEPVK